MADSYNLSYNGVMEDATITPCDLTEDPVNIGGADDGSRTRTPVKEQEPKSDTVLASNAGTNQALTGEYGTGHEIVPDLPSDGYKHGDSKPKRRKRTYEEKLAEFRARQERKRVRGLEPPIPIDSAAAPAPPPPPPVVPIPFPWERVKATPEHLPSDPAMAANRLMEILFSSGYHLQSEWVYCIRLAGHIREGRYDFLRTSFPRPTSPLPRLWRASVFANGRESDEHVLLKFLGAQWLMWLGSKHVGYECGSPYGRCDIGAADFNLTIECGNCPVERIWSSIGLNGLIVLPFYGHTDKVIHGFAFRPTEAGRAKFLEEQKAHWGQMHQRAEEIEARLSGVSA